MALAYLWSCCPPLGFNLDLLLVTYIFVHKAHFSCFSTQLIAYYFCSKNVLRMLHKLLKITDFKILKKITKYFFFKCQIFENNVFIGSIEEWSNSNPEILGSNPIHSSSKTT